MLRKTLISLLAILTLSGWGYASYKFFQPKAITVNNVESIEDIMVVNNAQLQSRAMSENYVEPLVYYYCNEEDANCQYVSDQILSQIASDLHVDKLTDIQYVDVETLDVETSLRRKSEYGFANYPAFVIYEEDGKTPKSALEFNDEAPFTCAQVEAWLSENAGLTFQD